MNDPIAYINIDGQRLPVTLETVELDLDNLPDWYIDQAMPADPFSDGDWPNW